MKTVAVYNNKGGVGKTTIAFHLARYAEAQRVRTMAVGMDRQGDLIRWLSGGDENIREGALIEQSPSLTALYSPDVFPAGLQGRDLVLVDCPPAIEVATRARADIFVVPVDGRLALQDLMNVLPALIGVGKVVVVFNRADAGGKLTLEALRRATAKIPTNQFQVWNDLIPDSAAIKRAAEYFQLAWDVPYGEGTAGPEALRRLCQEIVDPLAAGRARGRAASTSPAPRARR